MSETIQASVGVRNGEQCANLAEDQNVIMSLLDRIPTEAGGTLTEGGANAWPEAVEGTCSEALEEAILEFQRANQGAVGSADGHVDPGLRTLATLNQLAEGGQPSPPPVANAVPAYGTTEYNRYESAPDGTLIPIPSEAPARNAIRDDAQITVSPKTGQGYYVSIFNGPPESGGEAEHAIIEVIQEGAITQLEHLIGEAAGPAAEGVIGFAGFGVGVLISVFTPSPILKESFLRARMDDGTPVVYVVLDPQH